MMTIRTIGVLCLTLGIAACAGMDGENDIAVSQVPAAAMNAARGAVPGLEVKSAESKAKDGRTIYELDGRANGVEHEVKVTADGQILKVETDD